jgi:hypothetical protein
MRLPRFVPTAALLAVVALAACADNNEFAVYQKQLNTLVGGTEADLVRRMGQPTRTTDAGGQRALVYYLDWPGSAGKNAGVPGPDRFCELTFPIAGGKVASHAARGKACGWDGFPEIAPK